MHFVIKSTAPPTLADLDSEETPKWKAYHVTKTRKSQPKSTWLNPEIRDLIESDFHKSCCYCGIGLGEKQLENGDIRKEGEVDHFLPHSKKPDLVLDWNNLLWSCHPCNHQKLDYYSDDFNNHLLNPCCRTDMEAVVYLRSSGEYGLGDSLGDDIKLHFKTRLKLTEEKTYINAGPHPSRRKNIADTVIESLQSIVRQQSRLANKDLPPELTASFQQELESARRQFKRWVNQPDYPQLVRYILTHYTQEHPEQKPLLDEWLIQVGFEA